MDVPYDGIVSRRAAFVVVVLTVVIVSIIAMLPEPNPPWAAFDGA